MTTTKQWTSRRSAAMEHLMAHLAQDGQSLRDVADMLGITRQTVYTWIDVPVEWVHELSGQVNLPPRQLRPDIATELWEEFPSADESSIDRMILALSRSLAEASRRRTKRREDDSTRKSVGQKKNRLAPAAV